MNNISSIVWPKDLVKLCLFSCLIASFCSCNTKQIDTTGMKAQMKAREIKRIIPSQVAIFAGEWGNKITKFLNESPQNEVLIDSLQMLYAAKISKIDITKTDFSKADPKEKQVMEAYLYLVKENKAMVENLQKLQGDEIQLFTAPTNTKNTIWRIEFTKKGIINKATVKDIKKLTTNK